MFRNFLLSLITLTLTALLGPAAAGNNLPSPSGPYAVGEIPVHVLLDRHRFDVYAPTTHRTVVVSIYYPSIGRPVKPHPYLPRSVSTSIQANFGLPVNTTGRLSLTTDLNAPPFSSRPNGTLIFSPGAGATRLAYTALLMDLASHGWTIVAIDHPYDAVAVDFTPLGNKCPTTIWSSLDTDPTADIEQMLSQRVADIRFVTDQLPRLPGFRGHAPTKIGVFGHSLGGASSALAMAADPRLVGGINMDGTIFGPPVGDLGKRPFMLMGAGEHGSVPGSNETDPTWTAFRANRTSWVREWTMKDGGHMSYSDFQAIVEMDGMRELARDAVYLQVGDVDSERAVAAGREWVRRFFEWTVKGKGDGKFFEEPQKKWPEMKLVE